ncbi:MAG: helicase-related protein, partial [Bdellovibrionales bacterium]
HIEVPGVVFPLEIRHFNQPLRLITDYQFYDRVVDAISFAARSTAGDVLVFLPGTGEISRVEERVSGLGRTVVPLHGSLSLSEQRAALAPPRSPRIILATNVAEASVTVQGVDYVIDTGLSKVMEMNLNSGFSSLELSRISLFNARQRAGRAARQKAGVCLRLWTEHEEATQALEMPSESQRSDLSQSLLLLSHFGVTDFAGFAWLERPPSRVLDMARKLLFGMGAIDSANRMTEFGSQLIQFPLPPRLGALVLMADKMGYGQLGARIASILNERDFADRGATTEFECDILYRLGVLEDMERGQKPGGINFRGAQMVLEGSRALEKRLSKDRGEYDGSVVRKIILLSQKDRLSRRRAGGERGIMTGGRGVRLNPNSQVRRSEFFVSLSGVDLPGQSETNISMACGLTKAFVLDALKDEIEVRDEIDFVEEKGAFFNRRVRMFRDLQLDEPSLTPVDPSLVAERLAEVLARKWDWVISQKPALAAWMHRWNFLVEHASDRFSVLDSEVILKTVSMAAFGKT